MFFGCTLLWCGDIYGGLDISEVLGCHLLWQMSSQCVSEKLLQGLVSHELTAYLSIFNLFKLNSAANKSQKNEISFKFSE